jgi:lysophospholipase L1-like esterase
MLGRDDLQSVPLIGRIEGLMFRRRLAVSLAVSACTLTVVGCSSSEAAVETTMTTLPIGGLPSTILPSVDPADPSSLIGPSSTLSREDQVGALASGNRLIVIGDSITASTASRYGGEMCETLVPLGWQVEVDAQTGQFVTFGNEVLDVRGGAGWDAAVVFLGSNYMQDREQYRSELTRIVERLAPAPVVLLTVTEFQETRRQVNAIILEVAADHDNVLVIDWAAITRDDPTLLGADGLHPNQSGRAMLADSVALALGEAPGSGGACLPTLFEDDSMGPVTGTTLPSGGGSTVTTAPSTGGPDPTTTVATTVPATTTSAAGSDTTAVG